MDNTHPIVRFVFQPFSASRKFVIILKLYYMNKILKTHQSHLLFDTGYCTHLTYLEKYHWIRNDCKDYINTLIYKESQLEFQRYLYYSI